MKKFPFALLCCITVLLWGCQAETPLDTVDTDVPDAEQQTAEPVKEADSTETEPETENEGHDTYRWLIFSGEGEVTDYTTAAEMNAMLTDVSKASWNITDGILTISEPVMTVRGVSGSDVIQNWNGENQYEIKNREDIVEIYDEDAECGQYMYSLGSVYTDIAADCAVKLDSTSREITVTRGGETSVFPQMDTILTVDDAEVSTEKFFMLSPDVAENQINVPFAYIASNQSAVSDNLIAVLTLDLEAGTSSWSEPVKVPREYGKGLSYSLVNTVTVGGRLYFSTWEQIAYFDIETKSFTGFDDVFAKIDAFMKDKATRQHAISGSIPASICGNCGDIVAAGVDYFSEDGTRYSVTFAVRGNVFLGAVICTESEAGAAYTTYDENISEVHTYDVSSIPFRDNSSEPQSNGYWQ